MTQDELKQLAIDYLAKAFKTSAPDSYPPHIVQAAVVILSPETFVARGDPSDA